MSYSKVLCSLLVILGGCGFACAQIELEHFAYFVVQEKDTLPGYYDALALKDGKFEQHIETTFKGVGERKLHLTNNAKENEPRETRRHVIVSGHFVNGEPSGEWLLFTADFKGYSTCYGDLNWKRIDYENQDTTFIHYWNGSDYLDKRGQLLGGIRQAFTDYMLIYNCYEGKCVIHESKGEGRIEVPIEEIEITLDRISYYGF